MLQKDWMRFLLGIVKVMAKYMILGALIVGAIGAFIAAGAALFGGAGPLTIAYMASVAGRYALIGLFGGGIIGLLTGLLSQGSYSE